MYNQKKFIYSWQEISTIITVNYGFHLFMRLCYLFSHTLIYVGPLLFSRQNLLVSSPRIWITSLGSLIYSSPSTRKKTIKEWTLISSGRHYTWTPLCPMGGLQSETDIPSSTYRSTTQRLYFDCDFVCAKR